MTSSHFPIAIHILTLLATSDKEWMSSDYIANSVNINPVLVRKEIGTLRKFGLVNSKAGKSGGNRLAKKASDICLGDIYRATQPAQLLGQLKNQPNPDCPIGRQINRHLHELYHDAEEALVLNLKKTSLQDFCRRFE